MVTTRTVTTSNDPPAEFLPYLARLTALGVTTLNVCKNTWVVYVTLPSKASIVAEGLTQTEALDALVTAAELAVVPPADPPPTDPPPAT